ncbi:MAG TPA: TonB-dependent receptor, partial [Chitinophagaceae bacterium]|nr:TonB-dependent receptor [Chitinophagaceae bacterium]
APWMESISISKGATSVRNGHESITGAISIDYKKPFETDKLYADIFLNHMGRTELNVVSGGKLNEKWSGMLFTNAGFFRTRMDRNDDTFIDDPLYQQYSAFNRWHFQNDHAEAQIGARFLYDNREAGQVGHNIETLHHPYKINIKSTHAEAFLKNGYFFADKPDQSVGYQVDGSWHRQEALYGAREYNGTQGSLFGNVIFQTVFNNPNHGWVSGASGKFDRFRETFAGTDYNKEEWSAGLYAEYTYKHLEKITIMAGIRGDYHNKAGIQLTPKVHMRFVPWKNGTLRLSAGRGFRTANIFAENTPLLASSRVLVIEQELEPEVAWNTGISFHQKFNVGGRESSFAVDYYRTDFVNQVVTDVEGGNNTFRVYNLDGRSYSNSFQAELNMEAAPGFIVKTAYKLDDVRVTIDRNLLQKPFLPRHSGLLALTYETQDQRWQFDAHTSLHGQHRLPASFEGSKSTFSPIYATLNAQITFRRKGWEVYAGAENITNYTQKD